ncbi:hypothetical protein UR09_01605 [Candidatus Nitromaritima sp. SCGC AAA799-A02]|nr:hypothetical protein UZ36_05255 [Candidatus Nitromaritima sp. SCGC AAA799-C22]KMP12216.1 hypothetical protein UR09_01605 [Candidatus Nitromaritima sp. SCGC AAA799-A02]
MPFIRLQDLKPGTVSVEDIKDRTGRVILGAGSVITLKKLKTLKAWGVTEVLVGGDPDAETDKSAEENEDAIQESKDKELTELFRFTDKRHPVIQELFASCLARKMDSK